MESMIDLFFYDIMSSSSWKARDKPKNSKGKTFPKIKKWRIPQKWRYNKKWLWPNKYRLYETNKLQVLW